jgi:hypothetical protein
MDLFDISSEEYKNALFEYATEYDEYGQNRFIVKGRYFDECQYISDLGGSWDTWNDSCFNQRYSYCGYNNTNRSENVKEIFTCKQPCIRSAKRSSKHLKKLSILFQ